MPENRTAKDTRIPVTVLTGFLGSGKTTLLNRILQSPNMENTVVIVNEFGEIGLDHLLIGAPEDETILLANGCLCCSVLGDMIVTLSRLLERRDAGDIAPFARIIIETSGMADPSPLLQTIISDETLCERLRLAGVVTVVDAVNGGHALRHHFESVKQVVAADRIVISKIDIAASRDTERVRQTLAKLNPGAEIITIDSARNDFSALISFHDGRTSWRSWVEGDRHQTAPDAHGKIHRRNHGHVHAGAHVRTISVTCDTPASHDGFRLWLNALSRFKGPKLLRVKGIINVEDSPYVINAVQRIFHEPILLDNWPSADRSSRIVFIANGLDEKELAATTRTLGFRPSRDPKIDGLDFASTDYQRFVSALSGFSVTQRL